ncbi:helix-turn-helix domain-containing protein [Natrialba sp. PRR66]|uniref:winged helix-turn-helix domain-containing protein n=1 Tax=Natrialba sp. PRR66 TaxID=3098146 RepID=UPI002B1DCA8C|nr:helix-turn-helix domain-containing protein [Natrialba sp. PRR66]
MDDTPTDSDAGMDADGETDTGTDLDPDEFTAENADTDAAAPANVDPADAFAALGNSIRVDILRAFLEHQQAAATPVVQFSTLRRAVGLRDSGQFRYHLEQLRGTFVEKCDGGYRLTYAGSAVLTAIVAGTYTDTDALGPTPVDSACTFCGAAVSATYRDGILTVSCENEHPLFVWALPPNAAAGASIEDLIELATTLAFQSYELVVDGTCSECYSSISPEFESADDSSGDDTAGQSVRFTAACDACGAAWSVPVGFALLTHPEIERLYHRQGRPLRTQYWWELDPVTSAVELEFESSGTDPNRVRLSVDIGDTTVRATLDETGSVAELEFTTD